MPAHDSPAAAARRARLQEWIDRHYQGRQAAFVAATGINQGELSGLLRNKSFGEKKAQKLEAQAGMPAGYLTAPFADLPPPSDVAAHIDPVILAASLQLVRLAFDWLETEYDPEENGEPVALAYAWLLKQRQCTVTASNVVDFGKYLKAKLQEGTSGEQSGARGADQFASTSRRS